MVPVYSIESWLALVLRAESDFNKVLALVRKGCESVVVISFVGLLLAWLGGPEVLAERLEPGCCRHLPPLSFVLPSWAPAPRFVRRTLTGVLQNALCSVVAVPIILLAWCGCVAHPRAFEIAQPFCLVLMNASQFFAVYCVVTFYHANREQLGPLRPVQKLLSIKGLVFCLFWQEAGIRVAERAGLFDGWLISSAPGSTTAMASPMLLSGHVGSTLGSTLSSTSFTTTTSPDHWSVSQVAWGLLNSMICVEMFLLSLLHRRLYPPGEATRLRSLYGDGSCDVRLKVDAATSALEVHSEADLSLSGTPTSQTFGRQVSSGSPGGLLLRTSSSNLGERSVSTVYSSSTAAAGTSPNRGANSSPHRDEDAAESRVSRPPALDLRLRGKEDISASETTSTLSPKSSLSPTSSSQCSAWPVAEDDPALSGNDPGEVWRRFLVALDLSDIARFYQAVSGLASSHREPQEQELEAFAIAGSATATTRNRASFDRSTGSGGGNRSLSSGGSRVFVV